MAYTSRVALVGLRGATLAAVRRWKNRSHITCGLLVTAAMLLLCSVPRAVEASLVGDSVTCTGPSGLVCDPPTATVGAGPEFSLWFGTPGRPNSFIDFSVDVDASSITLTVVLPGGVNLGLQSGTTTFGSLDSSAGDIVGASLLTSGLSGIDTSDLSFTAHSVSLDINGIWNAGGSATISLAFANAAVPEPSTLVLLASAVAGLGAVRAWKRR